ncbi:hypothetical protein AXG93_2852s1260 [Marchantia polymorpha subsp. ruderalis]|uniref:Uncharacterized protein n=1 Tax=Marchantia polymorpha subsp. ruderalis TaxID=1480154 RepID=A0A176WJT0_MARPO|nr:hypothetical protein AXG93_2852s1260 [Marchantia polymorpha subsp. ruderalis]
MISCKIRRTQELSEPGRKLGKYGAGQEKELRDEGTIVGAGQGEARPGPSSRGEGRQAGRRGKGAPCSSRRKVISVRRSRPEGRRRWWRPEGGEEEEEEEEEVEREARRGEEERSGEQRERRARVEGRAEGREGERREAREEDRKGEAGQGGSGQGRGKEESKGIALHKLKAIGVPVRLYRIERGGPTSVRYTEEFHQHIPNEVDCGKSDLPETAASSSAQHTGRPRLRWSRLAGSGIEGIEL